MNKESDITVYVTDDYSMFKKLLGNRAVKSVNKIIESVLEVGALYDPLLVNEKYEVIDGQNRLEALKELGMPVHYIIQPGIGYKECQWLNIGRSNWSTEDHIYFFAERGNQEYRRLASLMMEFQKKFGIHGIINMTKPNLLNEGGALPNHSIQSGSFELSPEEYELAIMRMSSAERLGYVDFGKRKKLNSRVYWACVSYIYQHQEVEAAKVIEALRQFETLIPSCTKVSEQLQFFDDAINRGTRRSTDKIFLSTDFQKRKYIERK